MNGQVLVIRTSHGGDPPRFDSVQTEQRATGPADMDKPPSTFMHDGKSYLANPRITLGTNGLYLSGQDSFYGGKLSAGALVADNGTPVVEQESVIYKQR